VFYREAGQFKTSYGADQAIFPIAQDRWFVIALVAFAFAIAWSLAGQYFFNRGMWSAAPPEDAALSTGLESYRREVERRRYLFGRVLLWSFGPVVLAIATLIALIMSFGITNRGLSLQGTLRKMIPFLTLVVIWIVGVFVIRMREQRELRREIDQLNDIEKENRR